jgi:hypothetical protein
MARYEEHNFYCMNCGRSGVPIRRPSGHKHSVDHRKKLYCPWCKIEVNHIECSTEEEIADFKERFNRGEFVDEAKESMDYCRVSGVG